jgi:hypothetical protein
MHFKCALTAVLTMTALVLFGASPLEASIEYLLKDSIGNISRYPAPYGCVTVTRTSNTTATIVFEGAIHNGRSYSLGGASALALNVNGSVASWSANSGKFSLKKRLPARLKRWGKFNFVLNRRGRASKVTLQIVGSNTLWLSDSDVLIANPEGNLVASHLFVSGAKHSCSVPSGYAAASGVPEPVPEPASALIWSIGACVVAGFPFAARRRGSRHGRGPPRDQ